jgi:hypothetical protein
MILFEITAKSLVGVQQKIKPKVLGDEDLNRYGKIKWYSLTWLLQLSNLHLSCRRVCGGGRRFHRLTNIISGIKKLTMGAVSRNLQSDLAIPF